MTPQILDRLVSQLRAQGKSESDAFAIAKSALIKSWNLDESGNVTQKWIIRWSMSPAERAIDRASKKSGRPKSDYVYDARTNTAHISWLKK